MKHAKILVVIILLIFAVSIVGCEKAEEGPVSLQVPEGFTFFTKGTEITSEDLYAFIEAMEYEEAPTVREALRHYAISLSAMEK